MSEVRVVRDPDDARRLAHLLLDPRRTKPVAVVAVGTGRDVPWVDPREVAEAVGDYADVVRIDTGDITWAFSAAMPPDAQVYGDAGRVYGTDLDWVTNPRRSRLRLCFGSEQGASVTEGLVSDAMQAALAAGLFERRTAQARPVSGTVLGVAAGRAVVVGDFGTAVIREELGPSGVPLDRLVRQGQEVVGLWEASDGLLDVSGSVRPRDEALSAYETGDAVLAKVAQVSASRAVLELYPGLRVEVGTAQVTGNDRDDLTDLMSEGEVVVAHVLRVGAWLVSLVDVDDDEGVRPAPSLLPDGPPWLVEPSEEPTPAAEREWVPPAVPGPPVPSGAAPTTSDIVPAESSASKQLPPADVIETRVARRPSPLDLDPSRREAGAAPPPVVPAVESAPAASGVAPPARELHLERAARKALQDRAAALRHENTMLASRLAALEHEVDRLKGELERKRTETRDLRKQAQRKGRAAASRQAFLDAEQQLRHDVYLAWAEIVPAGEKASRPLPLEWAIGPDFLASLDGVEGVSRGKVVEVVVHVLTGLDTTMPGRDLHRLRAGPGGEDPYVERAAGEYCWRVALQLNAPSARRLHYWRAGDRVELSRVVLHDDFRP